MMSWLKRAASPATLIAVLALVAAVVGTAVAGPKQSNTAKTAKRALKLARKNQRRINRAQLTPGPQGQQGAKGDQGAKGEQGAKGDQGDPGAANVTVRFGPGSPLVGADADTEDTASCNPGEVATGGGYCLTGNATYARVYNNLQQDSMHWKVSVYNDAGASASVGVVAEVTCAAP